MIIIQNCFFLLQGAQVDIIGFWKIIPQDTQVPRGLPEVRSSRNVSQRLLEEGHLWTSTKTWSGQQKD